MAQILIWMLCVYLILKGKELQLIAASSSNEDRAGNLASAKWWALFAYLAAGGFFVLSLMQGSSIPGVSDYGSVR